MRLILEIKKKRKARREARFRIFITIVGGLQSSKQRTGANCDATKSRAGDPETLALLSVRKSLTQSHGSFKLSTDPSNAAAENIRGRRRAGPESA